MICFYLFILKFSALLWCLSVCSERFEPESPLFNYLVSWTMADWFWISLSLCWCLEYRLFYSYTPLRLLLSLKLTMLSPYLCLITCCTESARQSENLDGDAPRDSLPSSEALLRGTDGPLGLTRRLPFNFGFRPLGGLYLLWISFLVLPTFSFTFGATLGYFLIGAFGFWSGPFISYTS